MEDYPSYEDYPVEAGTKIPWNKFENFAEVCEYSQLIQAKGFELIVDGDNKCVTVIRP